MNSLAREIRGKIERTGPIPFVQFMEMALYAPGLGYYEQPREIGRRGDFFTSVSVGPLFGQLLAFQFAEWMDGHFPHGKIQLVESGAHDGRLAADILDWICRHKRQLLPRIEYCIIESSATRRGWQEKTLHSHKCNVTWATDIKSFGEREIRGIIFSNEFFDALPVHRFAWDAKSSQWREWHVAVADDEFVWHLDEKAASSCFVPPMPKELADVLPDGFILEVCPAAAEWWRTAAMKLRRGKLLTIDYGYRAENGLRPDHPHGTLRAYSRHHSSADILANPGEQDLTADVNFSALEQAGREAGLSAGSFVRQSKFLNEIATKTHANPEKFGPWDEKTLRQFQTLAHPEQLGHVFHVLTQDRLDTDGA